jgi:hypothetical protein
MEETEKGNKTNETVDLVAETLTDLPVAEEQAGEIKGGRDGQPVCYLRYNLSR